MPSIQFLHHCSHKAAANNLNNLSQPIEMSLFYTFSIKSISIWLYESAQRRIPGAPMALTLSLYIVLVATCSGMLLGWMFGAWLAYRSSLQFQMMQVPALQQIGPADALASHLQSAELLIGPAMRELPPSRHGEVILAFSELTGTVFSHCQDEQLSFLEQSIGDTETVARVSHTIGNASPPCTDLRKPLLATIETRLLDSGLRSSSVQ